MTNFGKFIKERRVSVYMSAIDLAKIVGCSPSFIRGIERDAQNASQKMGCKILDALNIEYKEIDALTLELKNKKRFIFKASMPGQNKKPRLNNYEARIRTLEERLTKLEKYVCKK